MSRADSDLTDPSEPHWYHFKQVNAEPGEWTFRVVDDTGDGNVAYVENDEHRFVIETTLVKRERTSDRYFTIAYSPVPEDGGDAEYPHPWMFHYGTTASIARNNIGWARESLKAEGARPHVLVRRDRDGDEQLEIEFPTEWLAETAADLQISLNLSESDRDYQVNVWEQSKWEDHVAFQEELAEADR